MSWINWRGAEITACTLAQQNKTTSRRRCYLLRPGWPRRDTHSKRKREGLCEWVGWIDKRGGQVKRHERASDGGRHQATRGGNVFIPNRAVTCTHIHVLHACSHIWGPHVSQIMHMYYAMTLAEASQCCGYFFFCVRGFFSYFFFFFKQWHHVGAKNMFTPGEQIKLN